MKERGLKSELLTDFHVKCKESIERGIEKYIKFSNKERPKYALEYMTPKKYREAYG